MSLTADPVPILRDNYAWLVQDRQTGFTAVIDPAEDAPIQRAIQQAGKRLDLILLTHHHTDHVAATEPLRQRYGARVVGARADAHRLPRLDQACGQGDRIDLGGHAALVIETPGHTLGHVAYVIADSLLLFCGDTLFSLGCGRLLEGTAADLFGSLAKFATLPDSTLVCCGHEYTRANGRFALTEDPHNTALQARMAQVDQLLAAGHPTVPSTLGGERATNSFLRAPDIATFAALRLRKDRF